MLLIHTKIQIHDMERYTDFIKIQGRKGECKREGILEPRRRKWKYVRISTCMTGEGGRQGKRRKRKEEGRGGRGKRDRDRAKIEGIHTLSIEKIRYLETDRRILKQ